MTHLKKIILETVSSQNIRMIPKWKFAIYSFLGVFSIIFLFIISTFLLSLIFFVLSRYGFMEMPLFGFIHSIETLQAIPVPLIFCTVLLLVAIEMLSRYYSFSFKRPLLIVLLGVTLLAAGIGFVMSRTPLHEYVREYGVTHHIDILSRAYDRPRPFKKMPEGMDVIRGEVLTRSGQNLTIQLFDEKIITAHGTTSETSRGIPEVVAPGDDVILLGNFNGEVFEINRMRPASKMLFGGLRIGHREKPPHMMEEK
jgi:hypothetical protein